MANQTRNKQRQERYRYLREQGYSSLEANKLKSRSIETLKKEVKKKKRNEKLQLRREQLRNVGYSSKEIQSLQHKSQATIDKAIEDKSTTYLVVGYKDLTEQTDSEALYDVKNNNKRRGRQNLIKSIIGWLQGGNQGYIGTYTMHVTNDLENEKQMLARTGYLIAYQGKGKNYTPLLSLIDMMMVLLYTIDDKDIFISELVTNLRLLPYKQAHENARQIEKEFLSEIADSHF